MKKIFHLIIVLLVYPVTLKASLPDQSVFDFTLSKSNYQMIFPITLSENSKLYAQILCESYTNSTEILLKYKFSERICKDNLTDTEVGILEEERHNCGHNGPLPLNKIEFQTSQSPLRNVTKENDNDKSLLKIIKDGIYIMQMEITSPNDFNASVSLKFKSPDGYLTAKDLPMLHFYAVMCLFYLTLAAIWLATSFLHWKELLRIQFWIGAVIFLGMLEKACFYFEYHQANENGAASLSLALEAEMVSCVKRTLSRILVLFVSMGFGITKSRLGDESNLRISVIAVLYFTVAAVESYLRLIQTRDRSENKELILAAIPLALIDSLICWWIFTSLIQTIRALKLRRNVIKLRFYEHFKNVLIFGVFMSVLFMIYSIKIHKATECAWKNLWVDQAFWHVLFSILLGVIAFLWRPTNNNQKYAFLPLLENDDEDELFVSTHQFSDTKLRTNSTNKTPVKHEESLDDDTIRWVEDNIVSSTSMLMEDSDEELQNTKFEISKMQ